MKIGITIIKTTCFDGRNFVQHGTVTKVNRKTFDVTCGTNITRCTYAGPVSTNRNPATWPLGFCPGGSVTQS